MSTSPEAPVATPAAPAAPKTAIQIIEQELANFIQQHAQAISKVHAIEGAIQGAQHLLGKLKAEAAKAEAATKAAVSDLEKEAGQVENDVKTEASKVTEFVKKEL